MENNMKNKELKRIHQTKRQRRKLVFQLQKPIPYAYGERKILDRETFQNRSLSEWNCSAVHNYLFQSRDICTDNTILHGYSCSTLRSVVHYIYIYIQTVQLPKNTHTHNTSTEATCFIFIYLHLLTQKTRNFKVGGGKGG